MRSAKTVLPCVIAAAALTMSSACSYKVGFTPEYFDVPEAVEAVDAIGVPESAVDGGVAVAMSAAMENGVMTSGPDSFTGGATSLAIPIARIVKEASVVSFGDAVTEGAVSVTDEEAPAGREYVVEPAVTSFSYKYDSLSTGGFAITPRVTLYIRVVATDAAGGVILDEQYGQDDFAFGSYMMSAQPHERINRAAHMLARQLTAAAARDFADAVAAQTPPQPAEDLPVAAADATPPGA